MVQASAGPVQLVLLGQVRPGRCSNSCRLRERCRGGKVHQRRTGRGQRGAAAESRGYRGEMAGAGLSDALSLFFSRNWAPTRQAGLMFFHMPIGTLHVPLENSGLDMVNVLRTNSKASQLVS